MKLLNGHSDILIIDICRNDFGASLRNDIYAMLRLSPGLQKQLPTMILYDEQGLKLFEDITYLDEYYLTNAEIEVLKSHADDIAKVISPGSRILELGSGNLRKINVLLQALERAEKNVEYYALDLSLSELKRTLSIAGQAEYRHVKLRGLHGTYDDGLAWLKEPKNAGYPTFVISLGTSIGNFSPAAAAGFLKSFANVLGPNGRILIGLDACQDKKRVYHAYNDREEKTREFYMNGLAHANALLDEDVFKQDVWDIIGEFDEVAGRHQAFCVANTDVMIDGVYVRTGEKILIEESYKYSRIQSNKLWQEAGLFVQAVFQNAHDDYHLHVLSVPTISYPLDVESYAPTSVPSFQEFRQLWAAWDIVTRQMIPEEELLSKPIKLRNCCIFYIGHIPTFLDIHITKAIKGSPTKPTYFRNIFERGIDPDVDNPEHCHAHSQIPDTWPSLEEILAFQNRVREKVRLLFADNIATTNRRLGRSLWLCFEHEAMHLETLLYMLVQSDKTLPPPGTTPDFASLSERARRDRVPNEWFQIPTQNLNLGLDDLGIDSGSDNHFGWDNETPQRQAIVPAFEAKARPITNEDFARYLAHVDQQTLPAIWTTSIEESNVGSAEQSDNQPAGTNNIYMNGYSERLTDSYIKGKFVKTVYGKIPLKYALDWPVMASYDELAGCAKWMGGRIPNAEEVWSIYSYVDLLKNKEAEGVQTRTISAVNGHLSNNGVEESPPSQRYRDNSCDAEKSSSPYQVFANLEGCNVGFKHYHPTPVTQNGNKLSGRCEMGGVWEWTSTVLEAQEGFRPMELYPGYTADFFDGKHNITLGGSWATHPRIAGRKTFVNWYQRNYLFPWVGARLVRDSKSTL